MQIPQTFLVRLCVCFFLILSPLSHCLALTSPRAKELSPLGKVRRKEPSPLVWAKGRPKVKVRPKERELAVSILMVALCIERSVFSSWIYYFLLWSVPTSAPVPHPTSAPVPRPSPPSPTPPHSSSVSSLISFSGDPLLELCRYLNIFCFVSFFLVLDFSAPLLVTQ